MRQLSWLLVIALLMAAPASARQSDAGDGAATATELARDNYREILELSADDPALRVEILRRLADLELDAAEESQLDANAETLDFAAFDNAIVLYQQLLDTYPEYRHNDAVSYQLASALELGGRSDDALDVLDGLIEQYPETPIIDEVQFRRGEMLFLRNDYNRAEQAYRDVVTYGARSPFYEQSLYKLGWSQFKLARYEDSLDPFFDLLDLKLAGAPLGDGENRLATLSPAEQELVRDTINVVSIGFSYLDGPDSIDSFLQQRGHPGYSDLIYASLAGLYLEKERFVDAAETYEAFVEQNPQHAESPRMQAAIVDAYERGGFPSLVIESRKDYVDRFGAVGAHRTGDPQGHDGSTDAYLKASLASVATHYHAEVQQEGNERAYREAEHYYRQYLEVFPGEPDTAGIHFMLSELLYENEAYGEAAEEYERTAYTYQDHARSAEAGYAALLAYRAHEESLYGVEKTNWHSRYLDSSLKFANTFPDHPEWGAVMTTVAEDLFAQDEFDRAIAVGQAVVERRPPVNAGLAATAWTVIAHSAFDLGDFAMAENAYHRSGAGIPGDDPQASRDIDERIASSIYKLGEQARDTGDLEGAVIHFRRVKQTVPDSGIVETAEYDAAAALINLSAWDRAAGVLEAFRRDFPDSEYAADVNQRLAVSLMNAGRNVEAAREFERISVAETSSDDVRREALWRAADLYHDAAAQNDEIRVLEDAIARYPDPLSESIEGRVRILAISRSRGDEAAVTAALEDLVRVDAAAGEQRSDRTKYLAANALLELAEPRMESFAAVRLTQPLGDSVKRKRVLMEDVIDAYTSAAEYGVAEVTTEATFRLGEAYEQFSADLRESERPTEIDVAALEQYELLLEEQVYPFEEKAIELYIANADRAASGIYDEWVRKSFDRLVSLMPGRYAKSERSEDVIRTFN